MIPVRRWLLGAVGKGGYALVGRAAWFGRQDVIAKRQNFGVRAAVVLRPKVDLVRLQGLPDGDHALRADAWQIVEDLLLEVCQAQHLRVWCEHLDALPRVLAGVLGLVHDDDGMPMGDRRQKMRAASQQSCRIGREQIERDPPLFEKQPLALDEPLVPAFVFVAEAARQGFLVVWQQDREPMRCPKQVGVGFEDVPEERMERLDGELLLFGFGGLELGGIQDARHCRP